MQRYINGPSISTLGYFGQFALVSLKQERAFSSSLCNNRVMLTAISGYPTQLAVYLYIQSKCSFLLQ